MESYEVLKKAITDIGAKSVASDMHLSSSLIYKWCEPVSPDGAGGAENPLDRLAKIYNLTSDTGPISWLCQKADGFFVQNPRTDGAEELSLFSTTRKILREFSDLLDAVTNSVDDGKIIRNEAEEIRKEWEELKSVAEGFVCACEKGAYGDSQNCK